MGRDWEIDHFIVTRDLAHCNKAFLVSHVGDGVSECLQCVADGDRTGRSIGLGLLRPDDVEAGCDQDLAGMVEQQLCRFLQPAVCLAGRRKRLKRNLLS